MKESETGPVVITQQGKPTAVLFSVADEDEIERLMLVYSPRFQAILQAGREEIAETGDISHNDFWQQVAEEYGSAFAEL